ncbi:hypothetical protein IJT93_05510 [bacterium]|nr:hypothetical protein [bacterium]
MSLNFSKIISWCLIVGSAALCADISAASLDRVFSKDPLPVSVSGGEHSGRIPSLSSSSADDVTSAFRQPEPLKPKIKPSDRKKSVSSGGQLEKKEAQKKGKDKEVKIRMEQAVLEGTLISDYNRAALLALDDGTDVLVGLGEELGNYILVEVDYAWARFESDTDEILFIADSMTNDDGGKKGKSKSSKAIVKKRITAEEEKEGESEEDGEEQAGADEKGKEEAKVTAADIRQALDNSAEMAKQLRVVPEERDGTPYGTRISFRTRDNLLARMGVKNNDVMLSINGVPTRSAEEMFRGYMTLRNASSFEFVLERGGEEQTIRYELGK